MKIYNKKGFVIGIFWTVVGSWFLIIRVLEPERFLPEQIKDSAIALILIVIGIGGVIRALSKRATRGDKLEELEERSQLIELKTKSKSFRLTQGICLVLIPAFFVMGNMAGENIWTGIGIGLAFTHAISMFAELFTCCYYERRT